MDPGALEHENEEGVEREPLSPQDFEGAAVADLEAAARRRKEFERLQAEWIQRRRNRTFLPARPQPHFPRPGSPAVTAARTGVRKNLEEIPHVPPDRRQRTERPQGPVVGVKEPGGGRWKLAVVVRATKEGRATSDTPLRKEKGRLWKFSLDGPFSGNEARNRRKGGKRNPCGTAAMPKVLDELRQRPVRLIAAAGAGEHQAGAVVEGACLG